VGCGVEASGVEFVARERSRYSRFDGSVLHRNVAGEAIACGGVAAGSAQNPTGPSNGFALLLGSLWDSGSLMARLTQHPRRIGRGAHPAPTIYAITNWMAIGDLTIKGDRTPATEIVAIQWNACLRRLGSWVSIMPGMPS
jgi:hypothetical protein